MVYNSTIHRYNAGWFLESFFRKKKHFMKQEIWWGCECVCVCAWACVQIYNKPVNQLIGQYSWYTTLLNIPRNIVPFMETKGSLPCSQICHWSLSWANKGCSVLNASQACNLTTSLYMYMHCIFSFTLLCCLMSTPHLQRCKHSSFYNILFLADSVPCCLTFILTTSCLDNTFYSTPPLLSPTSI